MKFLCLSLLLFAVSGQESIRRIVFPQDSAGWTLADCLHCTDIDDQGFDGNLFSPCG
jgi:hypothetical protein